jgi:hypothetical protein
MIQPAAGKRRRTISRPSQGRNSRNSDGPKEVDLVPIMNLFVTIIPMLLSMVVLTTIAYVSLDITQTNASGGGGSAGKQEKKNERRITKLELTINIEDGKEFFHFNKNGAPDPEVKEIPVEEFSALAKALDNYRTIMLEDKYNDASLKEGDEKILPIIIIPKDDIRFGTFVKAMDLCKNMRFTDIVLLEIE